MITEDERRTFKKYSIVIVLLEDIVGFKKRKVLNSIQTFNYLLKKGNVNIEDKYTKVLFFDLLRDNFKYRLKFMKLTEEEKNRLNGYYIAKWREVIRQTKLPLIKVKKEKF